MKIKKFNIFAILIVVASIFMGIGYAAVNGVTLDLEGTGVAIISDGVFISYAEANSSGGLIDSYIDTIFTSSVALSTSSNASTESFEITIYNNTDASKYYTGTSYTSSVPGGYTNENIDFTINGMNMGYELRSHESVTFTITFKYTDSYKQTSGPYNGSLSSIISFDFVDQLEEMVTVTYSGIVATGHPSLASTIEPLVIDFGSTETAIISVTMGGTNYSGYTFTNNILAIPEVTDNIVIAGVEKTEDVEYLFTSDAPITEEFTGDTAITSLTDLVANAHVHALNGTPSAITEIKLTHTYIVTGGNAKVITATLAVDDVQVGDPLTITYAKNAKTDTDVSVTFTGLNIDPSSKIYITFDISSANNGAVTLKKQVVELKFN